MSSPLTHLTDFSDRISPMLVKELRQGMRAKTFIVVFLSLQVFLAVMLFSAGAASTSDQVGSVISSIIFTFFSIAVLIIQPMRGTSALSTEVKGNTIDMMALTRLSAWRIVFGKWVAIVSQSALLLTTIIPYLILRYFFGGMNLVTEMTFLILIFLTSMGLTAITVGLSGCTSVIIRLLLPVIGLVMLAWTLLVASISRAFRHSGGPLDFLSLDSTESRIGVAVYIATVVYLGYTMLSMGASLIAPAAENHAFPRRLLAALLVFLLLGLSVFDMMPFDALLICVSIVVVPSVVVALTDSSMLVPTVCKPFVRRGIIGRGLGWLFYPTWESGVIHAILISLLGLVTIISPEILNHTGHTIYNDAEEWVVLFALLGSLFFPSVWQAFIFRGENQRLSHYMLIQVGAFVMLGVLAILADSMNSGGFLWAFAWNPLAFLAMLSERSTSRETIAAGVIVVDMIMFLILIIRAGMEIKRCSSIIQETRDNLETNG
jgi:hypothetical protein